MFYTIAAKTFFLGEYIALKGAPTLIVCTLPAFKLRVTPQQYLTLENIHPNSPAGQFIHAHPATFANCQIQFHDPYNGAGGLGASTAQFLGCYQAYQTLQHGKMPQLNVLELLEQYIKFAWDGSGISPSGADLIAQSQASTLVPTLETQSQSVLYYFDRQKLQLERYNWPFATVSFFLIRTGTKVATHQHLAQLTELPPLSLSQSVIRARQAILCNDSTQFIAAINEYAKALEENHLSLPDTMKLLTALRQHPLTLAAKGCGALGADIIAVFVASQQRQEYFQWLLQQGLQIVATEEQLV